MSIPGCTLRCLLAVCLFSLTVRADEKLDPAVEKFRARLADSSGDREKLRQEILTFMRGKSGTDAAIQASGLVNQLPSPLDKLDAKHIPELDRFDWQPKELVAVIGEHRGRHGYPVTCVVWTPDGKRVISGGTQGHVRFWDSTTLRQQALVGTAHHTTCLAVSRDSKTLAAGTAYGLLYVWDISGKQPVQTGMFTIGTSTVHSVDISRDGKLLAAGVYDGLVHTFDLNGSKPKERTQLSGHKTAARAVAFAPDSKYLAAGATDGTIRFWSFQGEKINDHGSLEVHNKAITCMVYNSRGNTLTAGCEDGLIARVAIGMKFTRGPFFKSPAAVTAVHYSPAGYLTSSHGDGIVRVWGTPNSPRPTATLEGHYGQVSDFAYSPDGKQVATGGYDWTVRLWSFSGAKGVEKFPLKGHWSHVYVNQFAPDGAHLACGSEDRTVRVWNLSKAAPVQYAQLNKDNAAVYALTYNPDGKTLASGGASVTARLWDLTRRTDLRSFPNHPTYVNHLHFTPDGARLLASSGKTLVLWNANTARELFRFDGHEARINSMSMSPDGKFVLTGTGWYQYKDGKIVTIAGVYQYEDCSIRLWDLRDGKMKKDVTKLERPVSNLTFAPDGRTFACSLWERPTHLWEASLTGLTKKTEVKNTSIWSHVNAFSPDGKRVVTLGQDARLRLTDLATDKVVKDWGFAETVAHAVFSADSRYLAVSLHTGPVYILRLDEPPALTQK
jgi:WD40 repeat protein